MTAYTPRHQPHIPKADAKHLRLILLFLLKCILCGSLKGLFNIDGFFCRGLEIRNTTLVLTPRYRAFLRYLKMKHPVSPVWAIEMQRYSNLALALRHIDLIAHEDKRKDIGIAWARLEQEFIAPAVEGIERLGVVHVVHKHAAIGATIEGYTQRLETFLSRCVPELCRSSTWVLRGVAYYWTYLDSHWSVVHSDLFGEAVKASIIRARN